MSNSTTQQANKFQAELFVPSEGGYGVFSWTMTSYRCLMTGCADATPEGVLAKVLELCSSASGYAHQPAMLVRVFELCAACEGSGSVFKMRRGKRVPFSAHTCKVCGGLGEAREDSVTLITNEVAS